MNINDIVDTVPVRNRFTKSSIQILHDGIPVVWAPEEVKHLPRQYADFFIRKSTLKQDMKGTAKVQALVIVGSSKPQEPLDDEQYSGPQDLIDRSDAPATMFGPDGAPLPHTVLVPITGIAGVQQHEQAVANREGTQTREIVARERAETSKALDQIVEQAGPEVVAQIDEAAAAISAGKAKQIAEQIGA